MLNQLPKEMLLEQVNNGLVLLLLGMGVVILFLTLLVFSTKFLSFVVKKFFPERSQTVAKHPGSLSGSSVDTAGAEIAAAITAAVAQSKR